MQYLGAGGSDVDCPLRWRFVKARSGSGALGDLGSHAVDLVSFITGLGVCQVVSQCETVVKERKLQEDPAKVGPVDVDDYANFMAELEGGATCCFQISRLAFARGNYQRLEIYGTRGALVYMLDANSRQPRHARPASATPCAIALLRAYRSPRLLPRLADERLRRYLLKRGDGLAATIEDGAENMKVLDAVLIRLGQWCRCSRKLQ